MCVPLPTFPGTYAVTAAGFSPFDSHLLIGTTKGVLKIVNRQWQWSTPPGVEEHVFDGPTEILPTVNTMEVIKFAFATDPANPTLMTDFVATVKDVYRWEGGAWVAFGPTTPSRPPGHYIHDTGYYQRTAPPYVYIASRIRGFTGGSDASRYVLYVSILTALDLDGGVYRYEKRATGTPVWTRNVQGLNFTAHDSDCYAFDAPVYERLSLARNAIDTPYVSVVQTTCGDDVYKRNPNTGVWLPVYDGFQGHQGPNPPYRLTNLLPGWIELLRPTGLDWGFGGPANGLTIDPNDSNRAVFTNAAAIHRTVNGASNWTQQYTQLMAGTIQNPPTTRWATTGADVTNTQDYVIHPADNRIRFILNHDVGLLKSTDSGATWYRVGGEPGVRDYNNFYQLAFQTDGPLMWAAASKQHDIPHDTQLDQTPKAGAILESNNQGETWYIRSNNVLGGPVVSILYETGALYVAVWGSVLGVYKSTSSPLGVSWETWPNFANNLPTVAQQTGPFAYRLRRNVAPGSGNLLHVSVSAKILPGPILQKGGLYQLDSSERTWTEVSTGIPLPPGATLAPMDYTFDANGNTYLCTADVRLSGDNGGVYRRDSSTLQWSDLQLRAQLIPGMRYWDRLVAFAPYTSFGKLYVTTITHGIWINDVGIWSEYTAIPFLGAQRLVTLTTERYIMTFGGGVWKDTFPAPGFPLP